SVASPSCSRARSASRWGTPKRGTRSRGSSSADLPPLKANNMNDRNEFLAWVKSSLYQAELALHNGDAAPRRALWSRREPVSVLGAWRNANGQAEVDALFAYLGKR